MRPPRETHLLGDWRPSARYSDWTWYLAIYLALGTLLVPTGIAVAGRLYPEGLEDDVAAALVMAVVFLALLVLYAKRPLYGFVFAVAIATTNLFCLMPSWVYKIAGVIRVDDLALLATLVAVLFQPRASAVREAGKAGRLLGSLLGIVVLELVYSVVVVGEQPWLVLREARPYFHYLWYFLPFFFIKGIADIGLLARFLLAGTVASAVFYSAQVVLHLNLGYVDTGYFETSSGGLGWRVWQGWPDLLFIALVVLLLLGIEQPRRRVTYWVAALTLAMSLFFTNSRSLTVIYAAGVLGAGALYSRASGSGLVRRTARMTMFAVVLIAGLVIVSNILGLNVLTARYDLTKTGAGVVAGDANLLVRLALLGAVIAGVWHTNPLLGLGFVSMNSEAAKGTGIEYFGAFQIRNNDVGVATIVGQGGMLLVGALLIVLSVMCARILTLGHATRRRDGYVYSLALFLYILCQLPLDLTGPGITSPQVVATIVLGLAVLELYVHFCEAAPAGSLKEDWQRVAPPGFAQGS